jgi:hypothetical protein
MLIFINMERDEKIIEMYSNGVTGTVISKELKIGRRTVYRVLEKYNTPLQSENKTKKNCLSCGKECEKTLCGMCYTTLRRYRVKKESVNYLGGKCMRCGWSGDLSGFDFHHRDSSKKDFDPSASKLANKTWEVAKQELDKCDLLCAICHRIEHSKYQRFEIYDLPYTGKLFKQ